MKKIILLIFIVVAFSSSCGSESLKILKWGPNEAKIGTIPNKQPDGKMGIWIDVNTTEGLGDIQILFAGKPAPTAVQPKLVTAGITPEEFAIAGDKTIEMKIVSTGQIIPVGNFKVIP